MDAQPALRPSARTLGRPSENEAAGTERSAGRFYHPELDVLRFFAFLLVFVHHYLPSEPLAYAQAGLPAGAAGWIAATIRSGGFGVDLFFLLSSYLITELLIREVDLKGGIDLKSFYIRRSLRIWPLYFFFTLFCLLVVPFVIPDDRIGLAHMIGFLTFTGNWTTAFLGYPASVIAPLWSVSVEEQFYVVWPLLIVIAGVRRIAALAMGLVVVAVVYRAILIGLDVPHPAIWASTLSRLDPIALGAVMAVVMKGRAPAISGWNRAALIVGGLAGWVVCARFFGFDGSGAMLTYPVVALCSSAVLLGVLCTAPAWRLLGEGPLVYLGRISYGLYVYHVLANHLAVRLTPPGLPSLLSIVFVFVLGFALTVVMAVLSYHLLEEPFLKMKQRFAHVRSRDSVVHAGTKV